MEDKLEYLADCIVNKNLDIFPYWKDIYYVIDVVLRYQELDIEKPLDEMTLLYNTFKDLFPYSGEVFRGFQFDTDDTSLNNILRDTSLLAFSFKAHIAFDFSHVFETLTSKYFIKQTVKDAFNFNSFLNFLCNTGSIYYKDFEELCTSYLDEYEVLTHLNSLEDLELFDVSNIESVEEVLTTSSLKYLNLF